MKFSNRPSFQYSNMEPRMMLAGDVSVFVSDDLFVLGDENSNQVRIVAEDDGSVAVIGLNNTTINGSSDPFYVEGAIDLDGAKGRNAALNGGLRVNLKEGHDRVDIGGLEINTDAQIRTGSGNDFVRIRKTTGHENLEVYTGEGDDTLWFIQSRAKGEFTALADVGSDEIELRNSRVWHNTLINSGKGNDEVTLRRNRLTGLEHHVNTQGGHDRIEIAQNQINESGLVVEAGNGNDLVFAEMAAEDSVLGPIELHGQDGFDAIAMDVANVNQESVSAAGFEEDAGGIVFDNTGNFDSVQRNNNLVGPGSSFLATILKADFVQLEQTTNISSIEWRGVLFGNVDGVVPETDNFSIDIYENGVYESERIGTFNAPNGDPVATFDVGNDVNRTDTGLVWQGDQQGDRSIYRFAADVDFEMEAGKIYWISIYNNTFVDETGNFPDSGFGWGLQSTEEFDVNNAASTDYGFWFTHIWGRFDLRVRA